MRTTRFTYWSIANLKRRTQANRMETLFGIPPKTHESQKLAPKSECSRRAHSSVQCYPKNIVFSFPPLDCSPLSALESSWYTCTCEIIWWMMLASIAFVNLCLQHLCALYTNAARLVQSEAHTSWSWFSSTQSFCHFSSRTNTTWFQYGSATHIF